jgi:hypothetical protein
MYKVSLPERLSTHNKIVLPISMSQPLERGEALKALLSQLELNYGVENITILICDFLNRHNLENEESALEMGDIFIKEHKDILSKYNVIRWFDYLKSKKEFEVNLKKITELSPEKSLFDGKMCKVHRSCKSSFSLKASINYQREEFALILCMHEFDALVYPQKISNSMNYLYRNIDGKKPDYIAAKVTKNPTLSSTTPLFFQQNLKKEVTHQSMHISLRLHLEQMKVLMNSSEIPLSSKIIFLNKLNDYIEFSKHESKIKDTHVIDNYEITSLGY